MSAATRGELITRVHLILSQWSALGIAVDNSLGGLHSREKGEWLKEVTGTFIADQQSLCEDDMEYYLSTIMDQEFDTLVEDGSLPQVSRQLCDLWRRYRDGEVVRGHVTSECINTQSHVTSQHAAEPSDHVTSDPSQAHVTSVADHVTSVVDHVTSDNDGWIEVKRKRKP